MSLRDQIQEYVRVVSAAEDLKTEFEDKLMDILWVYHQIGKTITEISNTGDGITVTYEYSCRGCTDYDSQFIPWSVIEADEPVQAAEKDLSDILRKKNEAYVAEQKRELERMKERVAQLEQSLGH